MGISTTYVSNIVALLTLALPVIGFEVFDAESATAVVAGLVGVVAILYNFYGRWRAGGISAYGIRRK